MADGEANIEVNAVGKKQKLHVTVKGARTRSAAFLTDVRPLLSTLGCNTRAVPRRGSRQGRTAAFSFRRRCGADFEALTKAAGGRRINRAEPRESLLYLKSTGELDTPGRRPARGNPKSC